MSSSLVTGGGASETRYARLAQIDPVAVVLNTIHNRPFIYVKSHAELD